MTPKNNYKNTFEGERNFRVNEQDRRISLIEEHIVIYNKEMGDVKADMAIIKTDVSWIKKNHWLITGAATTALITAIVDLIMRVAIK